MNDHTATIPTQDDAQGVARVGHGQAGKQTLITLIHLESHLGVHNLQEVVPLAFCEQLEFRLSGGLHKETIPFPRDGQNEIRGQLISPRILVE